MDSDQHHFPSSLNETYFCTVGNFRVCILYIENEFLQTHIMLGKLWNHMPHIHIDNMAYENALVTNPNGVLTNTGKKRPN